jgi:DNA-binding LytR/AlgR family response regulator
MNYTCAIIDDEPIAHDILVDYISRNTLTMCTVHRFYNTEDARNFLLENPVDFIFLDIQLPGENGISFLETLVEKPITIMTTAFREHAIEAFDLGVIDYLVKPVSYDRFTKAMSRALEFIDLKRKNEELVIKEQDNNRSFTIKSGTRHISLSLDTITHIQGLKDYAIFYTDKQNRHVVKGYMKIIETILPKGYFTRVHKSFIVANKKIRIINRNHIEFDGIQVPIGKVYKNKIEKMLGM